MEHKIEVIQDPDLGEMYFIHGKEIKKPVYLKERVGTIVAISESGLGGIKHVFEEDDVAHLGGLETIDNPDWLSRELAVRRNDEMLRASEELTAHRCYMNPARASEILQALINKDSKS